jgi:hypothetical protein
MRTSSIFNAFILVVFEAHTRPVSCFRARRPLVVVVLASHHRQRYCP